MKALLAIDTAGMLGDDLFDQVSTREALDLRDRAFMVELVRGVLRYRATLDWRLGLLSDRRITKLPTLVQTILRLGAYQLLYLDRVPDSAAVNESVQMTKQQSRRLGRDWSGFVNAVLRALLRSPEPAWPDAGSDPVVALAVRYSCPAWLVERWCHRLGVERAEALCRCVGGGASADATCEYASNLPRGIARATWLRRRWRQARRRSAKSAFNWRAPVPLSICRDTRRDGSMWRMKPGS
jgi:transcription termination factor NusB